MSDLQALGSLIAAAAKSVPGSPTNLAVLSAARRAVHEIYMDECRRARESRDKWIELLDAFSRPPPEPEEK